MKIIAASIALSLILILGACTPADVTVISDPYFEAISFPDKNSKSEWIQAAEEAGKRLDIDVFSFDESGNSSHTVKRMLQKVRSDYVICTPLASFFIIKPDIDFGDNGGEQEVPYKHMFFLNPPVQDDSLPQTTIVVIDRKDAFKKTARLMEEFIEKNSNMRAAALFYTGTQERKAEMNAFFKELADGIVRNDLYHKELSNLDDRKGALDFIQEVKTRDIDLLFLAASSLNTVCMEQLSRDTMLLITEKSGISSHYGERILFSIKMDYKDIMLNIITEHGDTEKETLVMEASVVEGNAAEASQLFE